MMSLRSTDLCLQPSCKLLLLQAKQIHLMQLFSKLIIILAQRVRLLEDTESVSASHGLALEVMTERKNTCL
jgi:hypothetical protein